MQPTYATRAQQLQQLVELSNYTINVDQLTNYAVHLLHRAVLEQRELLHEQLALAAKPGTKPAPLEPLGLADLDQFIQVSL
jgi:hypothetical protein